MAQISEYSSWLPGIRSLSKKVFCRLKNKVLYIYPSKDCPFPRSVLNFDQLTIHLWADTQLPKFTYIALLARIGFFGSTYKFEMKTDTIEARDKWLKYIESHSSISRGSQTRLSKCAQIKKFWRVPFDKAKIAQIDPRELKNSVQTGDILLFRSQNLGAKLQRVLTNSDYGRPG